MSIRTTVYIAGDYDAADSKIHNQLSTPYNPDTDFTHRTGHLNPLEIRNSNTTAVEVLPKTIGSGSCRSSESKPRSAQSLFGGLLHCG